MAYSALNSPLPGLTVTHDGDRCCGMRGSHHARGFLGMLGDDPVLIDTTSNDNFGTLTDPISTLEPDPMFPTDTGDLPLPPTISPLESAFPPTVGTEFVLVGPDQYTNIQTGQVVPLSVAQEVTAATSGSATSNLDTVATGENVTLTDPNTGITSTVAANNLTTAAQALQAAGQLVNAAGKLTAQGQALLNGGNLYNAPPSVGANFSGAIASLTSWFTQSTMIAGFPNWGVLAGVAVVGSIVSGYVSSRPRKRKR